MQFRILDLLSDIRADHLDFVHGISGFTGEESEREGFETFVDL